MTTVFERSQKTPTVSICGQTIGEQIARLRNMLGLDHREFVEEINRSMGALTESTVHDMLNDNASHQHLDMQYRLVAETLAEIMFREKLLSEPDNLQVIIENIKSHGGASALRDYMQKANLSTPGDMLSAYDTYHQKYGVSESAWKHPYARLTEENLRKIESGKPPNILLEDHNVQQLNYPQDRAASFVDGLFHLLREKGEDPAMMESERHKLQQEIEKYIHRKRNLLYPDGVPAGDGRLKLLEGIFSLFTTDGINPLNNSEIGKRANISDSLISGIKSGNRVLTPSSVANLREAYEQLLEQHHPEADISLRLNEFDDIIGEIRCLEVVEARVAATNKR